MIPGYVASNNNDNTPFSVRGASVVHAAQCSGGMPERATAHRGPSIRAWKSSCRLLFPSRADARRVSATDAGVLKVHVSGGAGVTPAAGLRPALRQSSAASAGFSGYLEFPRGDRSLCVDGATCFRCTFRWRAASVQSMAPGGRFQLDRFFGSGSVWIWRAGNSARAGL